MKHTPRMLVLFLAVSFVLLLALPTADAFAQSISHRTPTSNRPSTDRPYIPKNAVGPVIVKHYGNLFIVEFHSSSTEAGTSSAGSHHITPNSLGCFPGNAIWTWSDVLRFLQSWIGPRELDSTGLHNNLHVQALCGGDYHNYHIRYKGVQDDNYVWESSDSVTGETKDYEAWIGLGESDASDVAGSALAGDVGSAAGDASLGEALVGILPEVLLGLLLA